ncbi:MAG: hypothetical protein ACRDWI_06820 [Jiangellaceae bacterium]
MIVQGRRREGEHRAALGVDDGPGRGHAARYSNSDSFADALFLQPFARDLP